MRKTFISLLLFLPVFVFANKFVVTSNADSGAGTLRDAFQQASDNGVAVRDSIVFNIANTTEAGRTIMLQSTLPNLTSNILIDGSTQAGSGFGVSNARIELTLPSFPTGVFSFLFMYANHSKNIEIDGLFFYQPFDNDYSVEFQAIHFDGCIDVEIGRVSKGNYFLGFTHTITNLGYSIGNQYINAPDSCENIVIQANIDGLDLDGSTSYQINGGVFWYSKNSIYLANTRNILVGGESSNEGNHIVAFNSINIQSCYFDGDTSSLKILNNKLGTNINDTSINGGSSSVMESDIILKGISDSVTVKNNILTGQISLLNLTKYFYVQGNKIYNSGYITPLVTKIAVGGTVGGLIGGGNPGDANQIFSQNHALANYAINSGDIGVTIYKNIIYCNQSAGSPVEPNGWDDISAFDTFGRTFPWVIIDSTANGFVKGRSPKNCKIDIYQDDECPACEGKMYLASTTSDAQGNWVYKGPFTGVVVATATDSTGTTFAFSNPFIRDDSIKIKQPTCGKKNGSIKGIKIIGGDNWEWRKVYVIDYNQYDSLYSTKLDVDNLEAGTYILRPKLGSTCNGFSKTYTLGNVSPLLNQQYAAVTQPSCGQNNGSITGIGGIGMDYSKLEWRDAKGNIIGNTYDIASLFAGVYTLYAIDTSGGGCIDSSAKYTLINQSGPSLKTDSMRIINATCGNSNGSIKNISYQNTTGNIYTAWEDSLGNVVSNTINLVNVSAGNYRLIFKDGGGCDTILTNYYTIADNGVIKIDSSKMQVSASTCKGANGSITGITSTNATIYKWVNTFTGDTVRGSENITNVPSGSYQLICSNSNGCKISTGIITIKQAGFLADTVVSVTIVDANCNLDNGYVTIHQFTKDSSLYSFQWVNNGTNNLISTNASISNLTPGSYSLYATDTGGCRQQIFATEIKQIGKPQFDYSQLKIVNDTCNQDIGAILFNSNNPNNYTWAGYNITQQPQSTSPLGIINLIAGQYYATITDQYKCTTISDTFTVSNVDIIPPAPQAADAFIPRGTQATITITNFLNGTYNLYDTVTATIPVSTSTTGTFVTPPVYYDKQFYIQYVQGDCTSSLQAVWVKVFDSTIISVPNAFSPNGDGINDTWRFTVQGIVNEYNISVFNRYGQVMYTSSDINKQWDGTVSGKPLPIGTYYYIIQAKDNNNKPIKQSGFVVILR